MKNLSTRLLLTCAAIGVAHGILALPIFAFFSPATIAIIPVAYAALIGVWFFGGVLMQSLSHRPGAALLTTLIAGLVTAPFTPYGLAAVASTVSIGVCQELPFLATLYRKWPAWLFYVANGLIGFLYAFAAQQLLAPNASSLIAIAIFPTTTASALFFTWLARMIAHRLDQTGVTRGLKLISSTR